MADGKTKADAHPGMMGDGTEEQNLGQAGNPDARITEGEVKAAFGDEKSEAEKPEADEDETRKG